MMKNFKLKVMVLLAGGLFVSSNALACASCGCSLDSDWSSQGYSATKGLALDLRYDDINQNQARIATHTTAKMQDLPAERELEQNTHNKYTTVGLDYAANDWGVNVQLPFVVRTHTTITEGDTEQSGSSTHHSGDAKITARYQGFTKNQQTGVIVGLKLPTGKTNQTFKNGTQQGEILDASLQTSTGTLDAILSVYHFAPLSQQVDYFTQLQTQFATNSHHDYKPGTVWQANLGLRYLYNSTVTPQLQTNIKHLSKDKGAAADIDNSGGTQIYISPGVDVKLNKVDTFAFVQLPVYQDLNGYQLAPKAIYTVGLRYKF